MAKDKKQPRPKAVTPKGFRDYFGTEVTERAAMLSKIAAIYHAYGFDALESSAVETVEALGKFLPDVDRPNEGVFAWQEADEGDRGEWLALRYDLTAPLARVYAQHRNDLPAPYRRYAMGPVWRNEKPGPGRFRQFYQCDADTVGAATVAADAEICAMLADALEAVGIPRGDYVIRINNRKVLNGVLEVAGVGEDSPEIRGVVLRAIDKIDRLGAEGVRHLLGRGRRDESGDFTSGADLSEEQIGIVMSFLTARDDAKADIEAGQIKMMPGFFTRSIFDGLEVTDARSVSDRLHSLLDDETGIGRQRLVNYATFTRLKNIVGASKQGNEGIDEVAEMADLLAIQGYGHDRIILDPSVVRGLGYYTGPVFEAELTFEITDDKGRPRQFGSVAGGGRYDDLVKRFTGQAVPATGISIGVDRLLAALTAKGRTAAAAPGPVVVTVMDRDRMADYQAMVAELRQAGIRAEVYLGNPKNFGNQLKYADKRGSPVAIIEGGEEKARGVVQVKDLVLGAKIAENATLEEWKERPSQVEVPRGELVARVRAILDGEA
ncbi:histidyl-tRNA synthetase [Oceanicola granulosus HTCC2516]|uniref:Histidine--tRNA ligase n=1 Tax=Oceanicola granulosus (strain ATCC BAA-861 / DSM 15982 / KCTC 12143 / HTCC2516) TaxID=314256 RepID=Q2CAN9_OCEGH|nr:histidine--tRNA ligase [Oceanicola granulosus]EAR49755.1 histidyl-tRNA synthetase [Oceanicola granulosus HTCC2516]